MGEHTALLNNVEGPYKRQRIGDGVSLILAKESNTPYKYTFDETKYTYDEAVSYAKKLGVDNVINARLSMKATNGKPEIDGRIWSAGMHHVFVNDKPARVYVPEETIMNTFEGVRNLIQDQGRLPIGIDHLSDDTLIENEILAKMNLLDVGSVSKVGTDGQSIYILDSELTNQQIRELNSQGELPAYSIVGAMDAKPCPSGQADYVVNSIDVERVDIVQDGGCQVCKVGAQPGELILTSKKSEEKIMAGSTDAAWDGSASRFSIEQWKNSCLIQVCDNDTKNCYKLPVKEPDGTLNSNAVKAAYAVLKGGMGGVQASAEQKAAALKKVEGYYKELGMKHADAKAKNGDKMVEANEAPVEEVPVTDEIKEDAEKLEDDVEETLDDVEEVADDVKEDAEDVVEVVDDVVDELKKEINELKEELKKFGGKKPKEDVSAKASEEVDKLIKAGKALPKMKAGLVKTYEADPEAFATLAASMPKMVKMETKAKFAKKAKEDKEAAEEAAMQELIKQAFRL